MDDKADDEEQNGDVSQNIPNLSFFFQNFPILLSNYLTPTPLIIPFAPK